MKYTDEVPTVSGWYWVKRNRKVEVKHIDVECSCILHWRKQKEKLLIDNDKHFKLGIVLIEFNEALKSQPDSFWLIEYCGPLVPPQ